MKIVPKKSLGQNFLTDINIINKIIDIGNINEEDDILEVGPGTGNLTREILKKKPRKIFLIEKEASFIKEILLKNLYSKKEKAKHIKKLIYFINELDLTVNEELFFLKKLRYNPTATTIKSIKSVIRTTYHHIMAPL